MLGKAQLTHKRLHGQAGSAFGPSAGKYGAAALGTLADQETMGAFTLGIAGLEGTFHLYSPRAPNKKIPWGRVLASELKRQGSPRAESGEVAIKSHHLDSVNAYP